MWAKDVQFALRMMVKNPLFAIMIIITLALGVGVNTAIFSVVNFILLRPLPVANPSQIMVMAEKPKGSSDFSNVSYPDFIDFREQSNSLIDLSAYQLGLVGLSSEGEPERAVINYVTGNFFSILGVVSEIGRVISPEEGAQHYASLRTLQIRTAVQPEIMVPQVEQLVRSIAPDLPLFDARSMKDALNGINGFFLFRLGAALSGTLGGLGLILAVVGIYGVISYTVTQRRQEIGIRMAIGAQRSHILQIIMRQGLIFVAVGLFAGLLLAVLVGLLIQNLLVGIGAIDPVTFAAVAVLLGSNAFIASLIPALRALRADPIITLKAE